ncbi:hypothetical protein Gotur_007819 [Gossypium turneri]
MLSEMVNAEGSWNFDFFRLWLPKEIFRRIVGIHQPTRLQILAGLFGLGLQMVFSLLKVFIGIFGKGRGNQKMRNGIHHGNFKDLKESDSSYGFKDVSRRNEQISVAQVLESWISLCSDRVVQIIFGNATARGVIRNGNGEWIMGYNRYLDKCSVFDAELWGILDGLALIQYRRYDDVMIQTDSLELVKSIQDTKILFLILLIQ